MVRDMNLLGMDLTQALIEERKRTPSDVFAQFLDGMIATASSGADIQQYLVKQSKSLMNDKRLKTKAILGVPGSGRRDVHDGARRHAAHTHHPLRGHGCHRGEPGWDQHLPP